LLLVLGIKVTSAVIIYSQPPGKRLIRHTMARCSGSNLARPVETLIWVFAVLGGTGIYRERGREGGREGGRKGGREG
jgi:hypothetical protein